MCNNRFIFDTFIFCDSHHSLSNAARYNGLSCFDLDVPPIPYPISS